MSKHIANTELVQALGGKENWKLNGREVYPGELLLSVIVSMHQVMNAQRGEIMTLKDTHHGSRVIERVYDPVIELEDADYEWLKTAIETYAPRLFGVNGALAIRIVAGATDLEPKLSQDGPVEDPKEALEESTSPG